MFGLYILIAVTTDRLTMIKEFGAVVDKKLAKVTDDNFNILFKIETSDKNKKLIK